MGVDDSGHRVDLEVLVGHHGGYVLDWSPTCEGWLSIVEPFIADMLDVIVVNVSNSCSNLTVWNSSSDQKHLSTDSAIDVSSTVIHI